MFFICKSMFLTSMADGNDVPHIPDLLQTFRKILPWNRAETVQTAVVLAQQFWLVALPHQPLHH